MKVGRLPKSVISKILSNIKQKEERIRRRATISIYIDLELLRTFRRFCAAKDLTLCQGLEAALVEYMKKRQKGHARS